ncbi:unnamed protein product [Camellia sinensis]
MLQLELGATVVNLVAGEKPADVYSGIAAVSRRATFHETIRDYEQAASDLHRLISLLEKQSQEKVQQCGSGGNVKELRQARRHVSSVEEKAKNGISLDHYLILVTEPPSQPYCIPDFHSDSDEGLPVSGDESMHEILQKALLRTIHDIDTKFSLLSITDIFLDPRPPSFSWWMVKFLVASVGDSKALLCSEKIKSALGDEGASITVLDVEELTRDHHPDRDDERARIEAAGGFVRLWGVPRVNGILAVSRSIGDVYLKRYGVSPVPEVIGWRHLTANDCYLVVASDGIFESLKPQKVCDLLWDANVQVNEMSKSSCSCSSSSSLADRIVNKAFKKGSRDNLSAVVIPLNFTDVDRRESMCGILAVLGCSDDSQAKRVRILELSRRLKHRGPDWSGLYHHGDFYLAHQRLAIVDPASGDQPLFNEDKKIVVTVNGEIYNHEELRKCLPKHKFRTGSDCEVISHLYEEYGEEFVDMLDGMFSFVLLDTRNNNFIAARDGIGITSLYIGWGLDGSIWISSELKGLNDDCEHFEAFPPGHLYSSKEGALRRWYNPPWFSEAIPSTLYDPIALRVALENGSLKRKWLMSWLQNLQAVIKRLMTDVPFGVLLSGGLDSSLVASITSRHLAGTKAAKQWGPQLHSFCVGLEGSPDLKAAKEVADYLGTIHHEFHFTVQLVTRVMLIYRASTERRRHNNEE